MTFATFWDSLCTEHGGLSHAVLHEAGHAVVAVRLGITFVDVSVNFDPREHLSDLGRRVGGGVNMSSTDRLKEVVRSDRTGSLKFCLAGALTERAAFGHCLDRSYETDLNLWRNYADLLDIQTEDTLEAALGEAFVDVVLSTNLILQEQDSAIIAVARALGDKGDMSLTYAEVYELTAANN